MSDLTKILIISIDHPWYDTRVYYKIARSLLKHNVTIHLITANPNTNPDLQSEMGFTYEVIPRNNKLRLLQNLVKKGKQFTPDITICIEPLTLVAGLAIRRTTACRLIYDCHEFYTEAFAEKHPHLAFLYSKYEAHSAKKANAIITVNELLVDHFRQINTNTYLCANFPNLEATQIIHTETPKKYDAIYIGSISIERGLKVYLETTRLFQQNKQPFSLLIIGSFKNHSTEQYFHNFIIAHNLQGYITFKHYMPYQMVLREILLAKVGLFFADTATSPRYHKGINIKVFDYLTQRIPVIINNLSLLADYVTEAQCGWIIEYNSEELYKCLCDVINTEPLLTQKGDNGYQYLVKHNIWEKQEPDLLRAVFGE